MSQPPSQPRGEVSLPAGTFVHPSAPQIDHAAIARAAAAGRRKQHAPPKGQTPVAGGPAPAIPHLTGAPQGIGSMQQHALAERQPAGRQQPQGGGFVEPAITIGPNQVAPNPAMLGIRPTDELPPQAKEDPDFQTGTGAMFAANQPRLAMKYGVIRAGKLVPPQQLAPQTKPGLSPESIRGLQAMQEAQRQQAAPPPEDSSEMGRASAAVGEQPLSKALSETDKEKLKSEIEKLDDFDYDQFKQTLMRDILNNDSQRKIIESRLQPMDIGDLITQGFIIQRVPIRPGFTVDFKSMDGATDLALKRLIMEDQKSLEVSERYHLDTFGLMSIAAVIHKINSTVFGEYVDEHGNFSDEKFRARYNKILKLPMPMLASLGANAFWFDIRVRKLFVAEELGNG